MRAKKSSFDLLTYFLGALVVLELRLRLSFRPKPSHPASQTRINTIIFLTFIFFPFIRLAAIFFFPFAGFNFQFFSFFRFHLFSQVHNMHQRFCSDVSSIIYLLNTRRKHKKNDLYLVTLCVVVFVFVSVQCVFACVALPVIRLRIGVFSSSPSIVYHATIDWLGTWSGSSFVLFRRNGAQILTTSHCVDDSVCHELERNSQDELFSRKLQRRAREQHFVAEALNAFPPWY